MTSETSVQRIILPSGNWWDLTIRPQWRHTKQWRDGDGNLVERTLEALTEAWSFDEDVTLEAVSRRDVGDMVAVLEVFRGEVVPFIEIAAPKDMAEDLFAGMVVGQIPLDFAETHIMAATGWSWQTLQQTPADIVHKMAIYLAVQNTRESKGTLDFSHSSHMESNQHD